MTVESNESQVCICVRKRHAVLLTPYVFSSKASENVPAHGFGAPTLTPSLLTVVSSLLDLASIRDVKVH
jgi:hypothetical protein